MYAITITKPVRAVMIFATSTVTLSDSLTILAIPIWSAVRALQQPRFNRLLVGSVQLGGCPYRRAGVITQITTRPFAAWPRDDRAVSRHRLTHAPYRWCAELLTVPTFHYFVRQRHEVVISNVRSEGLAGVVLVLCYLSTKQAPRKQVPLDCACYA